MMSDRMNPQSFENLLRWILHEYADAQSIFGIHRSFFHIPRADAPYALADFYGSYMATPIGPAAGPHTQLAQNIVSAWLCGGRFIELKTVQIMDELEIPRPCIDLADEGYNVEWSQEFKLEQSAQEYINAWALIHLLPRLLGWEGKAPLGTVFNMSVGYNLDGIRSPRMTRFMDQMADATAEIAEIKGVLRRRFPQFSDIEIPPRLTNSVALSTMHGCPPDEIERIGRYLLEERRLHTAVKLNPTLLGRDEVLRILHRELGFTEIEIPAAVFEHDLEYSKAVALIRTLGDAATRQGLTFGVKLSNTLAMRNHRGVLPGDEMYMSGRALYPITINLFHKLAQEFDRGPGEGLKVSFSAGADALNVADILAAGACPVTAVSDLLKPGGYARFGQWLANIEAAMTAAAADSLAALAADRLANLARAAAEALTELRYKKAYVRYGLPKTARRLALFDCVAAPCVEQCAVRQDVPDYAWWIAQGDYDTALEVILARNPLPAITGYVCNALCQTRCTRNDYEGPVAIRGLKRFAEEHGRIARPHAAISASASNDASAIHPQPSTSTSQSPVSSLQSPTSNLQPPASPSLVSISRLYPSSSPRVAIIGAGPSGLAAAYYLALNRVRPTIYEAKDVAGGMLRLIPTFRLPCEIIQQDVDRIVGLGAEIALSHPVVVPPEALLQEGFAAVYIASGFQEDARLHVPGIEGPAVFSALDLLARVRRGERPDLGRRALVIGGGDTAMDAARVAQRLTGSAAVVVYRRTRQEMPAQAEELEAALEEGMLLEELATPLEALRQDGQVVGLRCLRNRLGEPGPDGRRQPVPIAGSEFTVAADAIIVAVGQLPDLTFLDGSQVTLHKNGSIRAEAETGLAGAARIYAGGDVVVGPDSIIAACADGRRAAEAICRELGIAFSQPPAQFARLTEEEIIQVKHVRAHKETARKPEMLPIGQRRGFDLIEQPLTEEQAQAEAWRCVQCTTFCDKCVEVCPNRSNLTFFISAVRWMLPVLTCADGKLSVSGVEPFAVEQTRQILHVDDFCNECGNCDTFCVHQGRPWWDKPRLFLSERDFLRETSNALHVAGDTIRRRENGQELRLTAVDGRLVYECASVRVVLSPAFEVREMELKAPFTGELSLRPAAEMAVALEGVKESLPFVVGR
jgi:putative selenate reductase